MPYKHDDAKCLLVEQNPAGFPDWVADYTRSLRSLYITYGELPLVSLNQHIHCLLKRRTSKWRKHLMVQMQFVITNTVIAVDKVWWKLIIIEAYGMPFCEFCWHPEAACNGSVSEWVNVIVTVCWHKHYLNLSTHTHTHSQHGAKLALWSLESPPQVEKVEQGRKVLLKSDLPFCKRNLEKFSLGRTHTHTLTPLTNQCWDLLCKVKTEFWDSFGSVKMSVFSFFISL